MAWEFTDARLAREARRLARVVTLLAWLAAAVILLVVTGGYALSRLEQERQHVSGEVSRIRSETLAAVRAAAPSDALLFRSKLQAILANARLYDRATDDELGHYLIYDRWHGTLAELGTTPQAPVFRVEVPFGTGEALWGFVVVEQSRIGIIRDTLLVALGSALLAVGFVFAVRRLPVNAFYRAMVRLDKAQAARAEVESGLRAYVLDLEKAQAALQKSVTHLQLALEAAAEGSQAKSQFLASMSHELRTPLNAIIGFSEIMENQIFGPIGNERYGEYINLILGSGRHLLSLVNEILDLSKAGAGRLELFEGEIDLALLARDLLRTMQATADKAEVELISTIPDNLPRLRADPQRITQVLLNLISNAIKFNVTNGTVRIEAECKPADGMKISVIDTGLGIAAENIPKALERFGQIEDSFTRRYQGTGLGLPISKKLIELHGGTLMIKSTVGEGTTVTIWLPPERVIDASNGIDFEMALSHQI